MIYTKYALYLYFKWIILYNAMLDTRVYPSPTRAECVVRTEDTVLFVITFLIRWRAVYFIASLFAARKAERGRFRNETHSHRYNWNRAVWRLELQAPLYISNGKCRYCLQPLQITFICVSCLDCFSEHNRLIVVMKIRCVFCEVGTDTLYHVFHWVQTAITSINIK